MFFCSTDLKLWPVHGHVDPVCVGPESQVLLVVRVIDGVIELFVDLRQSVTEMIFNMFIGNVFVTLYTFYINNKDVCCRTICIFAAVCNGNNIQ
jgi:hypothetical protein